MHYILFGGGLDSSALALHLSLTQSPKSIVLCHYSYGQKAQASERRVTEDFAEMLGCGYELLTSDMRYSNAAIMENHDGIATDRNDNRLELRNPLLTLSLASYIASTKISTTVGDRIYLGFHYEKDDVFPDALTDWLDGMRNTLRHATRHKFFIEAPFSYMSRLDIARAGYRIRKDFFEITHTCYEGTECGKCKHCIEKAEMKSIIVREETE